MKQLKQFFLLILVMLCVGIFAYAESPEEKIEDSISRADEALKIDNWGYAQQIYDSALKFAKEKLGDKSKEAKRIQRLMGIMHEKLDVDAKYLREQAEIHMLEGKYEEAEKKLGEAYIIYGLTGRLNHIEAARAYIGFGDLAFVWPKKDISMMEESYTKAIEALKASGLEKSPEWHDAYTGLVIFYAMRAIEFYRGSNFDESGKMKRRALATYSSNCRPYVIREGSVEHERIIDPLAVIDDFNLAMLHLETESRGVNPLEYFRKKLAESSPTSIDGPIDLLYEIYPDCILFPSQDKDRRVEPLVQNALVYYKLGQYKKAAILARGAVKIANNIALQGGSFSPAEGRLLYGVALHAFIGAGLYEDAIDLSLIPLAYPGDDDLNTARRMVKYAESYVFGETALKQLASIKLLVEDNKKIVDLYDSALKMKKGEQAFEREFAQVLYKAALLFNIVGEALEKMKDQKSLQEEVVASAKAWMSTAVTMQEGDPAKSEFDELKKKAGKLFAGEGKAGRGRCEDVF